MVIPLASLLAASVFIQSATAPAVPNLPADPGELVRLLSHPDSATRDAAQNALMAGDSSALEVLKSARAQTSDPDVQLRLDALIVRAVENEAIGPSRITLKFSNAPLKEVLDELARQSKAQFSDPSQEFGNQAPRITIDVTNITFWQALAELRKAGNISFLPQTDVWRVTRNIGNQMIGAGAVESGAFIVQPMAANYSRSISYAPNNNTTESFGINLQMLSEPKIRLAQSAGQFRLTRAVDSNGNNLLGPQLVQSFGIGQNQFHISAQLAYPDNPGDKIAELAGIVKFSIARRVESMTVESFTSASKPVEKLIDGAKITIAPSEVVAGQPNWIGIGVVLEPQGDPSVLNRLQAPLRQLRVLDAEGRPLQMNQYQATSVSPVRAEYRLAFMPMNNNNANAGPFKLILDVPTSYREVEVPVSLRDLKMP